jgi:hypothetical protein
MTPAMLSKARAAAAETEATNVEFVESEAEALPFLQITDVTIQKPGQRRGQARQERHGFERIETGQLVDTDARSAVEDKRRKAQRFGARGTTMKAYKPTG